MATGQATDASPSATPQLPYRWGRIWGWCSIGLGVLLETISLVQFIRLGAKEITGPPWEGFLSQIYFGVFLLIMGRGLLKKRKYGFVIMLSIGVLLLLSAVGLLIEPATGPPWAGPVVISVGVFWGPCLYYYFKRRREFH
jgi:hypothetical protein